MQKIRFLIGLLLLAGTVRLSRLPWELGITDLLAKLALVDGTARYSTRRTVEDHGGPRRNEEIALRAQRIAACSVALDVLRSSSVLNACFRSTRVRDAPAPALIWCYLPGMSQME